MKENLFSGDALENALKSDALEQSEVELTGMVKASEKEGYIAFARGGCDTWVDMPTSMIEQAERIGQKKCKDHSHPQFTITLKTAATPEASVFAQLLAPQLASSPASGASPQSGFVTSVPVGHPAGSMIPGTYPAPVGPRYDFRGSRQGNRINSGTSGNASLRLSPQLPIGGGGTYGGGGGLYNYCWDGECCDCVPDGEPCWTDGAGRVICPCNVVCNPCQRCIFPW
jgi:hypothetical protein